MLPLDPVLYRQIPFIQKIIQDETWLEGERRGCRVASDDRVVRENVCRVILRVGHDLRESITRQLPQTELTRGPVSHAFSPAIEWLDWEI